ncbi:methyltransferase regulatory domain-containing protein [Leptotrichia sp. oral taxon 223]|uniref:methyltransferase regulatory domain-containing protein n=1 Tax=Leptotrichia sp. oral taxon 223 TaxID=712363 RepID=UPI0015B90580|nr:methyltransferase regulatory domain-containing protein [Leptotrichia sp. oral taxon 223]NWO19854.1 methyltransferase regulatory domain-containing protein [Leptotrichia sp. oral taxon 223]
MENKNTYNELLYKSNPFNYTIPALLEAYGRLYGLTPKDSRKARVLELGSSFGGNIITQALYNPESEFIGVDLTAEQVKEGNEVIEKIGLKNIKLLEKNILEINEDFGKFDYIIVHGVFSWVPDIVKEKIVKICNENLTEEGIAYISYNTYPGWKEPDKVREMMIYANKYFPDFSLGDKTQRGKAFISIVADQMKSYTDIAEKKGDFIKQIEEILKMQDYYVGHEYLEVFNNPMYLHEFVDLMRKENLEYVSDVALRLSIASIYNQSTVEKLQQLSQGDHVIKEQCLDYILDTKFRRALICKKSQAEKLNFTESFPNEILDSFLLTLKYTEEELQTLNEENTKSIMLELIKTPNNSFTVPDAMKVWENLKTQDENAKNEEKDDEIIANLRKFILNSMINGKIKFYCSENETVPYEENNVYIPETFRNYLRTLIVGEGANIIGIANSRNEIISDLNDVDVIVADILSEPKPESEILEELSKTTIYRTMPDGERTEVQASEYLPESLKKFEFLGYFVAKK